MGGIKKDIAVAKNEKVMEKLLETGTMLGALADIDKYKNSEGGALKPKPVTDEYLMLLIEEYNSIQLKQSKLSRTKRDLVEAQVGYYVSIELLKFDT